MEEAISEFYACFEKAVKKFKQTQKQELHYNATQLSTIFYQNIHKICATSFSVYDSNSILTYTSNDLIRSLPGRVVVPSVTMGPCTFHSGKCSCTLKH